MNNKKPILISGVQSTGGLHAGNYLGALQNFVALQNSGKYQCFFFVADYHSLNEDFNPKEKPKQILEVVLSFLAAGINPKESVVFVQSAVPMHAELTVILNNFAPFGELKRMAQFKDKSEAAPQNVNVGLFDYPVLMAADVLLYDATVVPVGEDQLQHLELARTLARKFNARFGKTFIEPKPLLTLTPRLMGLDDPNKKMSKSHPAGCLFLDDSPKVIKEKIMRATTDSGKKIKYDEKNKPGISNLLLIYSALSNKPVKTIEKMYKNKGYAEFKKDLAEVVIRVLMPFQKRKKLLKTNKQKLKTIIAAGNKKAEIVANKKIIEIKKKIGLTII
jgi:tryptophanyl-tRNA synthetase